MAFLFCTEVMIASVIEYGDDTVYKENPMARPFSKTPILDYANFGCDDGAKARRLSSGTESGSTGLHVVGCHLHIILYSNIQPDDSGSCRFGHSSDPYLW